MKSIHVMMAAMVLVLSASCTSEQFEEVSNPEVSVAEMAPVTVSVNGISMEQQSFTRTRASAVSDYNDITALTLAFYKSDTGEEVYKHTQLRNDDTTYTTFGEFSTSLSIGSYTMVVVANGGNNTITLTSPTSATYGEGSVRDTFVATQAVNITSSSTNNLSATLDRVVSALAVESTDERPASVTQMRFSYSAGGKSFSPTSGLATSNSGFVDVIGFISEPNNKTTIGSYLFLSADNQTMNVTIETLDADNNVLFTKTINDVPFLRNRVTKLTGAIYSTASVSASSFLVNTDWMTANEINF